MLTDQNGNEITCVYHASPNYDITEFKPRESTQAGAYVYASEDPKFSAMFGWRMSSIKRGLNYEGDKLQIVERKKDYLKEHDHPIYIYSLPADSFERFEKDNWEGKEVRSPEKMKPIGYIVIPSAYEYFKDLAAKGEIELYEYPNRPDNIPETDYDVIKTASEICAMDPQKNGKAVFTELIEDFPQFEEVAKKIATDIKSFGKDEKAREEYVKTQIYDEKTQRLNPELEALVKGKEKTGSNTRWDERDTGRVMSLTPNNRN